MPVGGFNPFDPFGFWKSMSRATAFSTFPPEARKPGPIAVKPSNGDPGLTVTAGRNSLTIAGRAAGPEVKRYLDGTVKYEVARGMGFTLDIGSAPTVDVFGATDFTAKNARLFTLDTERGWSPQRCAEMLAAKVNAGRAPFSAEVQMHRDGSATLVFSRDD